MASKQHYIDKTNTWNSILLSYNNKINIQQYDPTIILLSNGVCFFKKDNEYLLFQRRMLYGTFNYDGVFDMLYDINMASDMRMQKIKELKAQRSSITNKLAYEQMSDDDKNKRYEHLTQIKIVYNRQILAGEKPPPKKWNKGLTKHTSKTIQRYSEQLSKNRQRENNPAWGSHISEENKLAKSKLVKQRILDGVWTPHVHNSLSRWNIEYNGKKYRSSWEALFQQLNQEMVFEQLRIMYNYCGKEYVYIVDFVDEVNKICVEIKPYERIGDLKNIEKQKALQKYCEDNGFSCIMVSQEYFINNWNKFNLIEISGITRDKMRKINNEANKKGIYNQTFDCI
jgi:hypothetical protein